MHRFNKLEKMTYNYKHICKLILINKQHHIVNDIQYLTFEPPSGVEVKQGSWPKKQRHKFLECENSVIIHSDSCFEFKEEASDSEDVAIALINTLNGAAV